MNVLSNRSDKLSNYVGKPYGKVMPSNLLGKLVTNLRNMG